MPLYYCYQIVMFCYRGGAELLFDNKKSHDVILPQQTKPCKYNNILLVIYFFNFQLSERFINTNFSDLGTLGDLLFWVKDNLLTERPELFIQDDSV